MQKSINNIVFENMSIENIDSLVELENICFSVPWSKESFEKDLINNPFAYYFCAKYEEKVIGYVGIWKTLDEGNITNIAVHPDFRNIGIAKNLLDNMLNFCKSNEIKNIFLEVRKSNIAAINLYKKFNFKEISVRKNYYKEPLEDALIMKFEIQKATD